MKKVKIKKLLFSQAEPRKRSSGAGFQAFYFISLGEVSFDSAQNDFSMFTMLSGSNSRQHSLVRQPDSRIN